MNKFLLIAAAALFGMNISAKNLVTNGTFDTNIEGWTYFTRNNAELQISHDREALYSVYKKQGDKDPVLGWNYNAGVYYELPVLDRITYVLKFNTDVYKSETATWDYRTINVGLFDQDMNLKETLSVNVYPSANGGTNVFTTFDLSKTDVYQSLTGLRIVVGITQNSGNFHFDNVTFRPQMIPNGGFEVGGIWQKINGMAWATDTNEKLFGKSSGKYEPVPAISESQYYYDCRSHVTLQNINADDNVYEVTFWAKGAVGGEKVYGIAWNGNLKLTAYRDDVGNPTAPVATLTTEWAPYTFKFENCKAEKNFAFIAADPQIYWIDNVDMDTYYDPSSGTNSLKISNDDIQFIPRGNEITITVAGNRAAIVNIYGESGILKDQKQISDGTGILNLQQGTYLIQVISAKSTVTKRFVIQ